MPQSGRNRVIERGPAVGGAGAQSLSQPLRLVGERRRFRQSKPDLLIEADDEHFVFGIAVAHERESGRDGLGHLGPHAAAAVHYQADGDRHVFRQEQFGFLQARILVNMKILFLEASDEFSRAVSYGGAENDEVDLRGNLELARGGWLKVALARWLGITLVG